jgi:membrane associated rhomboid family serine protease
VERVEPGLTTLVTFVPLRCGSLLSGVRDALAAHLAEVAQAGRTEALGVMVIVTEEPITREAYERLQHLTQSGGRVRVVPWVADLARGRLFAHEGPPFGIDPDLFMLAQPALEQPEAPRAHRRQTSRLSAQTPWLTVGLASVIVLVWVAMTVMGGSIGATEQVETLERWGAASRPDMVIAGESWRLLTAGFLHIGIAHLVMNTLSLWWLGQVVEAFYGRLRMLVIYLVALVAGSVASLMFGPPIIIGAGASGAIFGLMGAILWYRLVGPNRDQLKEMPILMILAINLVYGLVNYQTVDNYNHLGGLVGGFAAAAATGFAGQAGRGLGRALLHGAATLVLLAFAAGAVLGAFEFPGPTQRLATAMVALEEGRYEEAVAGIAEASRRYPQEPALHGWLALIYYHLGRFDQAGAQAAEALRLDPANGEARAVQRALQQQGR